MDEVEGTCKICKKHVCIFSQFEADVMQLVRWHERAAALDTNRQRRAFAFQTYHRWRDRGSTRERIENCVESGIRCWFPDKAYMGFHDDEDRTMHRRAVDMNGNYVDAWWVYHNDGWVLEE